MQSERSYSNSLDVCIKWKLFKLERKRTTPSFSKSRCMKGSLNFLLNIPPKHYLIIFMLALTLTTMSGLSIYKSLADSSITPTILNGFPAHSVSIIGKGNVTVGKECIIINDSPDTLTQVYVYSSTSDFVWNFSAIATNGVNESTPLLFAINWGKEGNESIIVWGNTNWGWYYTVITNSSVNNIPLDARITWGSKYDMYVACNQLPDSVNTSITLSNSTWQRNLTIKTNSSQETPNNLFFLSVQAWAKLDARMKVEYFQSRFVSYNSERYFEQSVITTSLLYFSTCIFVSLSILAFDKRYLIVFHNLLQSLRSTMRQRKSSSYASAFLATLSQNKAVAFLILVFAGLRLIIAAFEYGHGFDLYTFEAWSLIIKERGVAAVIPLSDVLPPYLGVRPYYPYPPIIMYTLSTLSATLPLESLSAMLFSFVVKIPLILVDLLIGLVAFVVVRKTSGSKMALFALTLSLVNMLDSALWGQFDSFLVLFMIIAVWLISRQHTELGWVFGALALATKQTALPFLPALLVLSLRNRRFRSTFFGLMAFSLTLLLVWSPLLFNGYSLDFAFQNSGLGLMLPGGALSMSPEIPGTSIDAFNIWPLITWLKHDIPLRQGIAPSPTTPGLDDTLPNQIFGMSYYRFGLILFLVFYVPILLMIWKTSDSSDAMMKFGLLMLAFFILPTRIHDRYLVFSIAFLPLALAASKIVSVFYAVLTTTFSLNLLYGFSMHVNPFNIPNQLEFIQNSFSDDFILTIMITNIVVFTLFFLYCVRRSLKQLRLPKKGEQLGAH